MQHKKDLEMAFIEAYDTFADPIFRHCFFKVSSREIAKDLTQETFMKAWKYAREGKEEIENMRAFLYHIANNLIIDHYRKRKESSLDELMEGGYEPKEALSHEKLYDVLDANRAVELLQNLPEKYREVILMRYIEELSPGEIGEIIGESENVVSVRIHRALKKAQELFNHDQI
jgi:RNA polymerase sigma-70 factor, ECF subfamily